MQSSYVPRILTCFLICASTLSAQATGGEYGWWSYSYSSGSHSNSATFKQVMDVHVVTIPGTPSIRLKFDNVHLGPQDYIQVISSWDGNTQELTTTELQKWTDTSAYFNGESVTVKLWVQPGSTAAYAIRDLIVGTTGSLGFHSSICGSTDDRTLSQDWRAMRAVSSPSGGGGGCTIWAADGGNCVLSAAHCTGTFGVAEAEVPLSTSGGSAQHPPSNRQWPITNIANSNPYSLGNDWAISTLATNAQGELPAQLYGWYDVDFFIPTPGQTIRITGYGSTSGTGAPAAWNVVNKTHTGPYSSTTGTIVRYAVDTTGGNSGSPIIHESTGKAIGIHTNAGCSSTGGANQGTSLSNAGFTTAWNNSACGSPTFTLTLSSQAGNLFCSLTDVPAGTTQGFTLFSFNTTLPTGVGTVFGINADPFTLAVVATPAAQGGLYHWVLPASPAAYPNAAFTLPPGSLNAFIGMTADGQGIALGPGFSFLGESNVVRATVLP